MLEFATRMAGVVALASDLPIALWPVTLVLFLAGIWGALRLGQARSLRSWPVATTLVASGMVFVLMPAFAVAFWADRPESTPVTQELPSNILGCFWWGYALSVGVLVAFAKSSRLALAAVSAPLLWLNFAVFVVCIMGVSGVWL